MYAEVGINPLLGALHGGIVHGACTHAQRPSTGEFGGEGHTGTATRAIAKDCDARASLQITHEGIGSTEGASVGEDDEGLLPAHPFEGT